MDGKILLIDSSEFDREKTKCMLNTIGKFEIIEANHISQFNSMIKQLKGLILVIIDIVFPIEEDGFKVLELLRKRTDTKNVPIIIITKSSSPDTRKTALNYAVSDYIIKPYTISRLESSINYVVKLEKVFTYNLNSSNNIVMSLEDYITKEIKTCSRVKLPLSIIIITSLDTIIPKSCETSNSLKQKVYSLTTETLKKTLRGNDAVLLNNKDILIILPFTDFLSVKHVLSKLIKAVSSNLQSINVGFDREFYAISVTFPDEGMDFSSLMEVVHKKIDDKKLLEQIVSIPVDNFSLGYAKKLYTAYKHHSDN